MPARPLPGVDSGGHIRYLRSGWRCVTDSGLVVAGVGGIERGQRKAEYHEMAYLDEGAIRALVDGPRVDVLITHQGPSGLQGNHGSPTLDILLQRERAKVWLHGHAIPHKQCMPAGPTHGTMVVPLGDVAFNPPHKGIPDGDPGDYGWAVVHLGSPPRVERIIEHDQHEPVKPVWWREYRMRKWHRQQGGEPFAGQLVCPELAVELKRMRYMPQLAKNRP